MQRYLITKNWQGILNSIKDSSFTTINKEFLTIVLTLMLENGADYQYINEIINMGASLPDGAIFSLIKNENKYLIEQLLPIGLKTDTLNINKLTIEQFIKKENLTPKFLAYVNNNLIE